MMEQGKIFQRWYEKDPVVLKSVSKLENIDKIKQHQVIAFLMEEIIAQFPEDIYDLVMEEQRKRRWYDSDEACKIFMELLRHLPEELKKQTAIKTIKFMEDNE